MGQIRRETFSFDRAAQINLGFYEPGKTATLNDPAFTKASFPEAVVAHELMHQSLMINTRFGLFTQLVNGLCRRGFAEREDVQACHEIQWTVQEATATYVELVAVARIAPAKLAAEIDALPSSRNFQAGYREAFEVLARWLPLHEADDHVTLRAKELLVKFLGMAAMETDCLRRGLADAPSHEVLLDCMTDAPDDRFERLVSVLGKKNAYSSLLDKVRRHVGEEGGNPAGFAPGFIKLLRALSQNAITWEDGDFHEAASRLQRFWSPFLGRRDLKFVGTDEPLPQVAYGGPERAAIEMKTYKPQLLASGAVADFAKKATQRKLAVMIELALRDPQIIHIKLGAYVPERQGEPWPALDPSDEQSAAIPADITGLVLPDILLKELGEFPRLQLIVSVLLPGEIRHLANVAGSQSLIRRATRVYRLTDISREAVEEAVREAGTGEYLLLKLSPVLRLGCILRKDAEAFVIARLTSDVAVNLFATICNSLEIGPAQNPEALQAERDLLAMVGRF